MIVFVYFNRQFFLQYMYMYMYILLKLCMTFYSLWI